MEQCQGEVQHKSIIFYREENYKKINRTIAQEFYSCYE